MVIKELKPPSRSLLSSKWGKAMRDSFAKMMPTWEASPIGPTNLREAEIKRQRSTGYLEYPELELLPTHAGYKELQALEQQIDRIKRTSIVSLTSEDKQRCASASSMRTPLSMRVAQEVHKIQQAGRVPSPEIPDINHFLTPPKRLNTRMQERATPKSTSGASQQHQTPMSRVSYDECIPQHVLDVNDPAKIDPMVMRKRSKSNTECTRPGQQHKLKNWNGKARAHSVLHSTPKESGSVLEGLLAAERDKMRRKLFGVES
ncbi:hypothetical protein BJ170DRAFT_635997, partial [Xylariales sp. AK1849]